ncbi:hypothetical protein KAU51_03670, partial [Candidatus Parcubacteria bacterium]|nr:hypothetical protein [Candidatus Parcubacteria bacterium]
MNEQKLIEGVEKEFSEDFVDADVKEEKEKIEEKKYKDMTKEEQRERNIDILLGIGFSRSKKNQNQFIYIEGETLIGKTFDEKNPVGSQFWGFKDKNKLTNGDITELPIIKTFYAIRDGKEKMPERPKEMAKREEKEQEQRATAMMIKPNAVIQDAQKKADTLYSVVEKQHLYQEIKGKKYLQLEAWQTLGKFC